MTEDYEEDWETVAHLVEAARPSSEILYRTISCKIGGSPEQVMRALRWMRKRRRIDFDVIGRVIAVVRKDRSEVIIADPPFQVGHAMAQEERMQDESFGHAIALRLAGARFDT